MKPLALLCVLSAPLLIGCTVDRSGSQALDVDSFKIGSGDAVYRASAREIGSPDWSTTGEATTSTTTTVNRDGDVLRITGDGTTSESTNLGPAPASC